MLKSERRRLAKKILEMIEDHYSKNEISVTTEFICTTDYSGEKFWVNPKLITFIDKNRKAGSLIHFGRSARRSSEEPETILAKIRLSDTRDEKTEPRREN